MQKTAVVLGATLLGDGGSSLVLGPSGVMLWDARKPVLAHAFAEREAFPPCYLVSTYCQRGTHGGALKSHFIIVNFQ